MNMDACSQTAFGHPARYYSAQVQRPAPRKCSESEDLLRKLLEELDPNLKDRVKRASHQWNQVLREHLRTEMGFRMSVGDDVQAVPVRVMPGLPAPLQTTISDLDEDTLRLLLRMPLLESTAAGLEFLEKHARFMEPIPAAARSLQELLAGLKKTQLQNKIAEIHEDVLGAYFFRRPEIQLYWMAIALVSTSLGVDAESLALVVLLHELAHAYSHLGRDIDESLEC
jgi:hypothetical protein